jgi:CheY-like chemotaxis protein
MLLIEDNEMNGALATFLIEAAGHSCVVATDGEKGVEYAKTQPFDVILLDIQLPRMDGFTVLKALKQIRPQTPVIAVSSYAMAGDERKALAAGFDGYIPKPIEAQTFVQQILRTANLQ